MYANSPQKRTRTDVRTASSNNGKPEKDEPTAFRGLRPDVPTAAVVTPLLLSYRDAATTLGISKSLLEKLKRKNEIPFVSIAGRVLFDPDELKQWVAGKSSVATNS